MSREPISSNGLDLIIRYPLPCPSCGEQNLKIVRELITNDEIACSFCGYVIDLTDDKWRAGLQEFAQGLSELYVIPGKSS